MMRVILFLIMMAGTAFAVEPDEILDDPVLEQRARDISANVRCVVCQNEPIDSSNAGIARDLRIIIRERLVAGDSDQEVYDFLVARYGAYVLFTPPVNANTILLWIGPFVILLIGGLIVFFSFSGRQANTQELSEEEERALNALRQGDDK